MPLQKAKIVNNQSNKQIVAAFDFDGTLTYGDSFLPFLLHNFGFWKTLRTISLSFPQLIGFVLGMTPRQRAKEKLITHSLAGLSVDNAKQLGNRFASEKLDQLLKPEAAAKLLWHQLQGHRCIVISASVDLYLTPWAKRIGISDLICSKLKVNDENCLTGTLSTLNCWGPEKVRRLQELLGPRESYTLYAYGDSRGDKELLNYADYSFYRRF
jgi:HAD superfamily hydrolase (TIGR01490 family)